MDVKKYVAEFMGTAILVFCGVGAAMITGNVVAGALAWSAGAGHEKPVAVVHNGVHYR